MANYRSTNRHGLEIRPTTAIHEGVNKPRGSAEWGGFAEGRRGIAIIRARLRAITAVSERSRWIRGRANDGKIRVAGKQPIDRSINRRIKGGPPAKYALQRFFAWQFDESVYHLIHSSVNWYVWYSLLIKSVQFFISMNIILIRFWRQILCCIDIFVEDMFGESDLKISGKMCKDIFHEYLIYI